MDCFYSALIGSVRLQSLRFYQCEVIFVVIMIILAMLMLPTTTMLSPHPYSIQHITQQHDLLPSPSHHISGLSSSHPAAIHPITIQPSTALQPGQIRLKTILSVFMYFLLVSSQLSLWIIFYCCVSCLTHMGLHGCRMVMICQCHLSAFDHKCVNITQTL